MYTKPKYDKVVFVPDLHIPFHDKKSVDLSIEFIKFIKPDVLFFMGDVIDGYGLSKYLKDPEKELLFNVEIENAKYILNLFSTASLKSEKHYIRGNHEIRLKKYLWSNARVLAQLPSNKIESLLTLDKFKINYHDTGRMLFRNTVVKHGDLVRKASCMTAKAEFEAEMMSGISAHTHRLGIYTTTRTSGEYAWMECGHLADPNQEYLEGKTPDWLQGLGLGFYKQNSRRFNLHTVPITNHKAMFGEYEFYI